MTCGHAAPRRGPRSPSGGVRALGLVIPGVSVCVGASGPFVWTAGALLCVPTFGLSPSAGLAGAPRGCVCVRGGPTTAPTAWRPAAEPPRAVFIMSPAPRMWHPCASVTLETVAAAPSSRQQESVIRAPDQSSRGHVQLHLTRLTQQVELPLILDTGKAEATFGQA